METKLLSDHAADLLEAAALLQQGKVVGIPTETVYGLAADARNPEAVRQIFAAKGRPADNPLISHIMEEEQLKDLVEYQTGQVVSKTLVQNDKVSMTIFSFDKGEEISTHAAGGDAMVTVLEGTGKFTVGGEVFLLHAGETLIMPKDIPHAVYGEEQFKMQLVVSF